MVLIILRNPSLKLSFRKIQQPIYSIQLNVTILHTVSQLKQTNNRILVMLMCHWLKKTKDFLTVYICLSDSWKNVS